MVEAAKRMSLLSCERPIRYASSSKSKSKGSGYGPTTEQASQTSTTA
jgi:hypothetical protein